MSDWDIIRIKDDVAAGRWTIVYNVPTEYAPDGIFSFSMPKDAFNSVAVAFEYDIENSGHVDDMFDHLMTYPMLAAPLVGEPASDGFGALMRSGDPAGSPYVDARNAVTSSADLYSRHPADLRSSIKAGISGMKAGVARLRPAPQVELHEAGRLIEVADLSDNPKYIVMQDMAARLRPENIVQGRKIFQRRRTTKMGDIRGA
ncbi:hypothetical protein [Nonomuraea guangzhouensis]|uniref:Uncharacterized protein n=1 Tax=Nonomuraea guangzhouensis TaxID=1291555 RepID=A0ABW4GWZ7_9ACTN|nr:hypothetical protein [Nonomuraea guangzhouensis]